MASLELLDIARTVALEAGELIMRRRHEGVEVADRKSSSVDVVTFADRESEAFIQSRIAELRPQDGFFGEEGTDSTSQSGLTWIVDPIDGTVNYLYDIPQYAVSIGVVEGDANPASWTQLAGAVNNPVLGELYSAAAGHGAYLGDTRMHVNSETDLAHALVATGFSYTSSERAEQADVVRRVLPEVRDMRRAGAASLDLCAVASGRIDGYWERGTKPWDFAAGSLIVLEAGGVVGGLGGAPFGADMVIATNAALFGPLEELIRG
ncbi:MAG: hypothetical protein RIR88_867 [Actinomycetota bacterium]